MTLRRYEGLPYRFPLMPPVVVSLALSFPIILFVTPALSHRPHVQTLDALTARNSESWTDRRYVHQHRRRCQASKTNVAEIDVFGSGETLVIVILDNHPLSS